MLGCNHAALMGERDEQNTDPSCGIATMVLVDLILQGFTVNLESSIYCIFTAQTFLVPVTLFFSFPWSRLPLPRPCPLERVLIQIETGGAAHQQIQASTWHASLAGLVVYF